ncbi:MAG: branched-chain amino acid aminotransferase [Planctomycetaceae bacterium]|nr:branched-chain amino acid aminotransferase [Planctomycetaceae bacterium]
MSETIVYLNGRFIPETEAHISLYDMAVVLGATVTEMTRTFHHQPFRLDDHIDRLYKSLRYIGVDVGLPPSDLTEATLRVVKHNAGCTHKEDELGIVHFVTGGEFHEYVGSAGRAARVQPTVCVHTFPIPFHYFAEKLRHGAHVVTPTVRHIPAQCIDPKMKCRSRMHYFLAERQARLVDPDALCLMLDLDGNVTETSGSNFLIVERGTIVSPPRHLILPGISRATVVDLAAQLKIPFEERLIRLHDVANADEALSTTTPYCLCPVTRINGMPIGNGKPGQVFHRLSDAWSEHVGVDIVRQIVSGAERTRRAHTTLETGN